LIEAANVFRQAIDDTREEELVGLVSYAEQYTYNGQTVTTVSTNSKLTSNSSIVETELIQIGQNPIIGGTNISAGLDRAITVIQDPATSRPFAFKMIVLMTDGVWNPGQDPVLSQTIPKL
jgi:Ca-activated chloride channel family protein